MTVMTDLEKFIDTYKQFGVDVEPYQNEKGNIQITLCASENKFDGYCGMFSDLEFTKEGKFIRQGFWE